MSDDTAQYAPASRISQSAILHVENLQSYVLRWANATTTLAVSNLEQSVCHQKSTKCRGASNSKLQVMKQQMCQLAAWSLAPHRERKFLQKIVA
jgi:hypothetical protein